MTILHQNTVFWGNSHKMHTKSSKTPQIPSQIVGKHAGECLEAFGSQEEVQKHPGDDQESIGEQ